VIWRHGGRDDRLLKIDHHFDPMSGATQFDATPFSADADGAAANARTGDLLVWRLQPTGPPGAAGTAFIPNGDGAKAHGQIPSIRLPR
jgi:hypothetical protein